MNEEKYIQSLFEQAKKEAPKLSFDDAADHFKATLTPVSPMDFIKDLFSNINLNAFTMITISSVIISAALWLSSPTPDNNSAQPLTEITDVKNEKSPDDFLAEKNAGALNSKKETTLIGKEEKPENNYENIVSNIPDEKNDDFFADEKTTEKIPVKIKYPEISFFSKQDNKKQDSPFPIKTRRDSIPKVAYSEPNFPLVKDRSLGGFSSNIYKNESHWQKVTKGFKKEFIMDAARWTNIINEWGNVEIKTWDQNAVKFDIVATVSADKPNKAEDILENIEVKFNNSPNGISAETVIRNKKAIKWNKRKNWMVSIDYLVYLPKNSNLKLYQYNGDVFVEELYGAGQFKLIFADLEAINIGDHSKVHIKNGKAKINKSGNLETDLHFSEILANEVGDLKINGKNSTLKAKKAKNINCHSQWGKYKFGHIGNFETIARGDNVEIETAKQLTLDMTNGSIELDKAGDVVAKFRFMEFDANELEEIEMDLQNSIFKAAKAGNVKGETMWGELDLGDIKNYENKSKGTTVEIISANNIKAKGDNSKMTIGTIRDDIELDMNFGGCTAQLLNNTPNIDLIGSNADFDFELPSDAVFQIDVQSNTENFDFSSNVPAVFTTEKKTDHIMKGYFQSKNARNKIRAKLTWGKLKLRVEGRQER